LIRPPAGSTQCKQCRREPMPHSLLCRHQALDPAKSKQRHEICERRHWMEVLQCNENHTFPGTPLSLVLCATAPTILSNQQYGRLLPVDSGHEKLRLHVLDGWKSKTTNLLRTTIPRLHPCVGWPDRSSLPFSYPVRRQACMHTNLPRLEKEEDVELSWESCSFSLSRFAILSGAKEE
jgi:hypothetical protein